MQVRCDSVIPDTLNGACKFTGYVLVNYENKYYRGNYDFICKWSEESNGFVRDTGTFDGFYACDRNGKKTTSVFSTRKTLTNYTGSGQAKSVLEFDTDGIVTQKIYSTAGYLINTTSASYSYSESPICFDISVVTSSGHVETMYYFPNLNALKWDSDTYISY